MTFKGQSTTIVHCRSFKADFLSGRSDRNHSDRYDSISVP